ncbi:MAG: IS66 family insertion sequence element accessory protein TnpB [Gemmatimonadaceae bacterium]
MLSLPPGIQVFMAIDPVDMRKIFDGLSAAVQAVFARDVLEGHMFLFLNRRCDRIKVSAHGRQL